MKMRLPMVVAILFGAVTLITYFLPFSPLDELKALLLEWASVVSAVALLLGILNLLSVHVEKFSAFKTGWEYSAVLLIAFIFVLGMGLFPPIIEATTKPNPNALFNPVDAMRQITRFFFLYIQTPLEAALTAMLGVIMIMAGARLVYKRRQWSAAIFIIISVLLILSLAPYEPLRATFNLVRVYVLDPLSLAGARGILLGISLGAITTGLRIIMGVDRPYGE